MTTLIVTVLEGLDEPTPVAVTVVEPAATPVTIVVKGGDESAATTVAIVPFAEVKLTRERDPPLRQFTLTVSVAVDPLVTAKGLGDKVILHDGPGPYAA